MTTSQTSQLFSRDELEPTGDFPDAVLERARVLLSELEADLASVERALAGLEEGTYGHCVVCHAEIDPQTMAGHPTTERCALHGVQSAVGASEN